MCQKMTEQSVGRPSVMTDLVLQKLEEAFSVGATDIQACFIAGISKSTLYNHQQEFPEFVERKEALKAMTSYAAKKVVYDKITEGDKQTAQWHLERKDPEYNPKSTTDVNLGGQEGNQLPGVSDVLAFAKLRAAGVDPQVLKSAYTPDDDAGKG